MKKLLLVSLILSFVAFGCAGRFEYRPPNAITPQNNSVEIYMSKDKVWKKTVSALGKHFFVINNLDKESGLINISYSGDPERYVDCGYIESYVKNMRGERTYSFPASSAHQTYEIMDMQQGGKLFFIDRKMHLEGRMNLIVEATTPNVTLITANTRYILTRSVRVRNTQNFTQSSADTISFNTNQGDLFQRGNSDTSTYCHANGKFEKEVLSLIVN